MTELSGKPKFCPKCGAYVEALAESALALKRCPQCGTENPVGAKFCKNDGYAFKCPPTPATLPSQLNPKTEISDTLPSSLPAETSVAVVTTIQGQSSESDEVVGTKTNAAKPSSKRLLIGIACVIALVATGVGGYKYWLGSQAGPQASAVQGYSPLPPPIATGNTTGSAGTGAPPVVPLSPAATPTGIEKSPIVDVAKIHHELDQNLQRAGFGAINASVNTDGSVNLEGMLASRKERDEVVQLALSQYGVERVNESGLQVSPPKPTSPSPSSVVVAPRTLPSVPSAVTTLKPDPAKLEGDINRALRSSGIGGVTAQVGDDLSVTLKGSTTSIAEKNRAFQITRQFKGGGVTKDRVFVVE